VRPRENFLEYQLLLFLRRHLQLLLDESGAMLILAEFDDIPRDISDVPWTVFGVVAELVECRGRSA